MKTILSILLFTIFSHLSSFSQIWNTQISYETNDHLSAVTKMIKTSDDALLVLIRKATDLGFTKISHYLLKYNLEGELLWEREYDFGVIDPLESPFWGGGIPKDIIQIDNGNYFMTGTYADVNGVCPYVFLTDENGDSISFQQTAELHSLNYVNTATQYSSWLNDAVRPNPFSDGRLPFIRILQKTLLP